MAKILTLFAASRLIAAEPGANVVLILADNLGYGEITCYGTSRMVATPRIDRLATQGLRLTNFNVEPECVPSRAALLTGRYPIRSGAWKSAPPGQPQGITAWEVTLAEVLAARGYATDCFGKWHLGDIDGRWPTDQGFDTWYGIPRSSDESNYTQMPGFDARFAPIPQILSGRRGEKIEQVKVYNHQSRRLIDSELTERAIAFIEASALAGKPFFAYVPLTQVHWPTLCHPDFEGKTGAGDIGDAVAEMDHRVGQLIDAVERAGVEKNTIFIFTSDNGPEYRRPWRGTAGPWRGTYHTALEGSFRVPFIVRWPGHVPPGGVSNEVVHITDLFPTSASACGGRLPADRPIDGVDQLGFFAGKEQHSAREGFPCYLAGELYAVKWRDWKVHFIWYPEANEGPPEKLEFPKLFNLRSDPKEETDVMTDNTWVRAPVLRLVSELNTSFKKFSPIPPGIPDPYENPSPR